jgi:hypothetical protein
MFCLKTHIDDNNQNPLNRQVRPIEPETGPGSGPIKLETSSNMKQVKNGLVWVIVSIKKKKKKKKKKSK